MNVARAGILILLVCLCGTSSGCQRGDETPASKSETAYVARPAGTITFARDIAPIVFTHCASCHSPEASAPFSLLSYDDVKSRAGQIADVVQRRVMPPWLPDPDVVKFAGQRVLSNDEIGLIRQWAEEGAAAGNLAEMLPAPNSTEGWRLGEPDLVLEMPEAYTLPAEGSDVFRNFVIPINLASDRHVAGVEVRPGNPRLVHHGVMMVDTTHESRRLDGRDDEPGFGGMLYGSSAHSPDGHFVGWTPGKSPFQAPAGMAWLLEPGTDIVLQLHMLPTGKEETIRSQIGLYFTDVPPARIPLMLRLGFLEIDIPAGEKAYRINDEFRLPVDVQILGVYPHAHYLAKKMMGSAHLPVGEEIPLISIPDWNFNWQDEYRFEQPISVPAGTVLTMDYWYDNSAENPVNPHHPPQRILWGPNSSDEMGDLWVQVVPDNPADLRPLKQAYMREDFAARLSGFAHAVRVDPDDLEAHYNLASLSEQSGDLLAAETHYREALRIDPVHPQSLNNLGVLLCRRNEIAEAVPLFEQALKEQPDYDDARSNLEQARALSSAAP